MPRYFFHLRGTDQIVKDLEGVELPDMNTAKEEAKDSIRGIVAEHISAGERLLLRSIEICDEAGTDCEIVTVVSVISATLPVSDYIFEDDANGKNQNGSRGADHRH